MGNLGNHATDDLGLSGYAMVYHPFATDKFKRTEFTLCYGTYVQNDVRVAGHCSYGGANSAKKSATFSAIKFCDCRKAEFYGVCMYETQSST